jgi:hypothetical protein
LDRCKDSTNRNTSTDLLFNLLGYLRVIWKRMVVAHNITTHPLEIGQIDLRGIVTP